MTDTTPKPRWFRLTPDRLVIGLLVVECLLWLSERFQWLGFNQHKGYAVLIAVAVMGVAFIGMLLWFLVSLLFRWRFQFSIRSLLLMVVVVALPSSWLAVEMKEARKQHDSLEALVKMRGQISYDWQFDAGGFARPNAQPPEPEWLRRLFGDDFYQSVVEVDLHAAVMTQAEMLEHLECGFEDNVPFTDSDLKNLKALHQLKVLRLNSTQITEDGLQNLVERLNELQFLELRETKVTAEGVKKLQQALPNCKIKR